MAGRVLNMLGAQFDQVEESSTGRQVDVPCCVPIDHNRTFPFKNQNVVRTVIVAQGRFTFRPFFLFDHKRGGQGAKVPKILGLPLP